MFTAGIVVLGIGSMVAPAATAATSGGPLAAPSMSFHGAGRPSGTPGPTGHMSSPPRTSGGFSTPMRGFRMSRPWDRDHDRGRFRSWGGYPYYYPFDYAAPYYYPFDYAAPYGDQPYAYPDIENAPVSERARPGIGYRPGCRTDTQSVPSENGGERTINITRCY
jgi:hypothetical protein